MWLNIDKEIIRQKEHINLIVTLDVHKKVYIVENKLQVLLQPH